MFWFRKIKILGRQTQAQSIKSVVVFFRTALDLSRICSKVWTKFDWFSNVCVSSYLVYLQALILVRLCVINKCDDAVTIFCFWLYICISRWPFYATNEFQAYVSCPSYSDEDAEILQMHVLVWCNSVNIRNNSRLVASTYSARRSLITS